MPTTTVHKHLAEENAEHLPKKTTKHLKEHETKKPPVKDTDSIETQGPEGEAPSKKPLRPKKLKEKCIKSAPSTNDDSAIISSTPPSAPVHKKNAQRAKGSLSLNKTIEQVEHAQHQDKTVEKQLAKESTDRMLVTKPEMARPPGEERKIPVRPQRRKPKSNEEKEMKVYAKQKPPLAGAEEKTSGDSPEVVITNLEERVPDPPPEPVEKLVEELPTVPPPIGFSSCSFLEKIQQGVKAYFTSRSTMNSSERAKKGGGIRTRPSIAKEVKEDAKKKDPGFKLKNNIYNSERTLLQDQLRVDSGGESSNFSDCKPKILQNFRKMKHKKLYQPKSHYVRIQIPRKGYFCRSTVQSQSHEPESFGPLQRLLPREHTKSKPKSSIPGLAPSSSQISCLPNKKKLKKSVKTNKDDLDFLEPLGNYISDCFSEKYLEWLKLKLDDRTLGVNFVEKINEYIPFNSPDIIAEYQKFTDGETSEFENSETETERPSNAVPKNCKKFNKKFTKKRSKKTNDSTGSESKSGSSRETESDGDNERESENVPPICKKTEPLFKKIFDCINANLERELNDQMNLTKDSFNSTSIDENQAAKSCILAERPAANRNDRNEVSPPPSSASLNSSKKLYNPGSLLMGGIDLHFELQNYLKTFRDSNIRTKNISQCNSNPPEIQVSNFDSHIQKDDTIEVNSSISIDKPQDGNCVPFRTFFDFRYDLKGTSDDHLDYLPVKPFISQAEMFEKFDEVRRIKSNDDSRKLLQESKLKNTVKRTAGKTSFLVHRVEEITWNFDKPGMDDFEDHEKFSTLEKISDNNKKSKSELSRSFSTRRIYSSDRNKASDLLKKTSSSEVFLPQLFEIPPKWSPTLQDLIEIYNSILRHSQKITPNPNAIFDHCLSSDVISYLTTKAEEKHCKTKLINLSRDYWNNYVPKLQKPKKTKDSFNLDECVSAFQKILKSPLTINQITQMNDIISGLRETSLKKFNYVQKLNNWKKKKVSVKKEKSKPALPKSFVTKRLKKEPQRAPQRIPLRTKSKKPASPPTEQIKKIKLKSPTELESVLNLCFNSDAIPFENPETSEIQEKIKLDVKLLGNKILVNELSFFNNEKALSHKRHQRQESSELILENITNRETREGIWYKHNKTSKIRLINRAKEKLKNPEVKKPNVLPIKSKISKKLSRKLNNTKSAKPKIFRRPNNVQKTTAKKGKKNAPRVQKSESRFIRTPQTVPEEIKIDSEMDEMTENTIQENDPATFLQFEYDQMRLRAQHPIEAIVESSESKIMEEEQLKQKPKPHLETKKDTKNKKGVTKIQASAFGEEVFSKGLIPEFGWRKQQVERELTIAQKKRKLAKDKTFSRVKSMVDLKKSLKPNLSNLKLLSRSTYKCYPITNLVLKKKPEPRPKPKQSTSKPCKAAPKDESTKTIQKVEKPEKTPPLSQKEEREGWKKPPGQEVADISSTSDRIATESLSNTVVYLNNDITPDACSVEFPFSENKEDTFFDADSEEQFEVKHNDTSLVDESQEATASKSSDKTPITLHSKNSHVDNFSFFSEAIHSDSFLANLPNPTVSHSQIRSLSMLNSDLKFCPKRVMDNSKDLTPLITFVLTPSQHKLGGVPTDLVKVVRKRGQNEKQKIPDADRDQGNLDDDKFEFDEKSKEAYDVQMCRILNDESELKPIEDFIQKLSKARQSKSQKLEKKKIELKKKRVASSTTKLHSKMKSSSLSRLSQITLECNGNTLDKEVKKSKSKIEEKSAEKFPGTPEKEKKKLEEKKKPVSSDLFLNKAVKNFLHALENFQKEAGNEKSQKVKEKKKDSEGKKKEENTKEKEFEKKSDEKKEKKTNARGTLKKKSTEFRNLTPKLAEKSKSTEGITDEDKIIATIKERLGRMQQMQNAETECKYNKDMRTFTIKIYKKCVKEGGQDPKRESEFQQECQPLQQRESQLLQQSECQSSREEFKPSQQEDCQCLQEQRQTDLLESLVAKERKDLKSENSTYFDAEGKKGEEENDEGTVKKMADDQQQQRLQRRRSAGGSLDLNAEFGVKEEVFSESEKELFSKTYPEKDPEDVLFDKISRCLEERKISLAMTLLDEIFEKMDDSSDCVRLKRLLVLTEKKCKSLMMKLEKSAWFKVLSLLEEVSEILESQNVDLAVSQLETTKDFIDNIRLLNLQRLIHLQKFWSTFSHEENIKVNNSNNIADILRKIKGSLKYFKHKISSKQNTKNFSSGSGFQFNWTPSLHELSGTQKETEIQHLKRKLRHRKFCIEELMNAEDYPVFGEIQEIKSQIIEKINGLEKAHECRGREGSKATSSPEIDDVRGKDSPGPSRGPSPSPPDKNQGYIDLVKCLIKAWDSSMPFRTFSSERFS